MTKTKSQNIIQKYPKKNAWKSFAILIIGLLLTFASVIHIKNDLETESKQEFRLVCNELKTKITTSLYSHAQLLRSGSSFFAASDSITRQDWKTFNDNSKLDKNLPGIQGFGFSLIIKKEQLQQHIQNVRNEGFPEYTVYPSGDREIYTSIIYLEPFDFRNQRAFGYDTYSEPVRRKAMEQARDFDVAALTGKLFLLQETDKDLQAGTIMYVPVYGKGKPANTIKERRAAIIGWVSCPYRMTDLMHGILGSRDLNDNNRIHLQIYDDSISQNSLLFDSQSKETIGHTDRFNEIIPILFNDKKWTLHFSKSNEQFMYFQSNVVIVFIGGLIISLLLFFLSLSLFNTSFRAQQIAEKLTSELKKSEEKFKNFVQHSPDIIYKFSNKRGGLFWSESVKDILGFSPDEIKKNPFIWNNSIHPDYKIVVQKAIEDHKKGSDYNIEYKIKTKSGKWIWLHDFFMYKTKIADEIIIEGHATDITARKQIELILKQKNEEIATQNETLTQINEELLILQKKYSEIFEQSPIAIEFYDTTGSLISVNKSCIDLFGVVNRIEIFGFKLFEDPNITNEIKTKLLNKETVRFEAEFNFEEVKRLKLYQTTCSGIKILDWHISPIMSNNQVIGYIEQIQDISVSRQAELALKESEERWKFALEGARDGLWDWNMETNEVFFSTQWKAMLGFEEHEIQSNIDEWRKRVHPNDLQKCNSDIQLHLEGKVPFYSNIHRVLCKNGLTKWILDRGKIIKFDQNDKPIRIIGTHTDLTERVEMEKQLTQLNADKDRFITILAHDLKSPFNSILGFLELLTINIRKYDIEKIENFINIINESAQNTFNLLENILVWIRANSGKIPFEPQKLNFGIVCTEIIESLKLTANTKNITINHFSAGEVTLFADKNMLNTVLRNLVSNAIKFTNKGGQINIYAEKNLTNVIITVSDNGVGIEPDTLNKLFDISEKVTTEGTANEQGTGLGLLLCKEFVEKNSGTIWVESELGKGSDFKFTMPLFNAK